MAKTYSIVGMNFRKTESFVAALQSGAAAVLVREPTNKFDQNAVAVFIDGTHVGYIPKKQNSALAQFIDQSGTQMPELAMDATTAASGGPKAVSAKFVRSPNSGYPMVEV